MWGDPKRSFPPWKTSRAKAGRDCRLSYQPWEEPVPLGLLARCKEFGERVIFASIKLVLRGERLKPSTLSPSAKDV